MTDARSTGKYYHCKYTEAGVQFKSELHDLWSVASSF